jgi:hypothetical protein
LYVTYPTAERAAAGGLTDDDDNAAYAIGLPSCSVDREERRFGQRCWPSIVLKSARAHPQLEAAALGRRDGLLHDAVPVDVARQEHPSHRQI